MGKIIRSPEQLDALLVAIPTAVLDKVENDGVELLKQTIQQKVYDVSEPFGDGRGNYIEQGGGVGGRSMGFGKAWGVTGKGVNSLEIGYKAGEIGSDPSLYIHGSPRWGALDADWLANAILETGYSIFGNAEQPARDAWHPFINKLDKKMPMWIRIAIKGVSV